jgi:hypothetical protein
MGNHIVHGPPSRVDIDSLLHDLPGITWEANLGKARFLKTLKVIHDEGTAVCKIYLKPSPSISLEKYADRLTGTLHPPLSPCQYFTPIFLSSMNLLHSIRTYFDIYDFLQKFETALRVS